MSSSTSPTSNSSWTSSPDHGNCFHSASRDRQRSVACARANGSLGGRHAATTDLSRVPIGSLDALGRMRLHLPIGDVSKHHTKQRSRRSRALTTRAWGAVIYGGIVAWCLLQLPSAAVFVLPAAAVAVVLHHPSQAGDRGRRLHRHRGHRARPVLAIDAFRHRQRSRDVFPGSLTGRDLPTLGRSKRGGMTHSSRLTRM